MKGTVIVAPLNWGLGHATRCIPIIELLLENTYTPVLASDGVALDLLRKEFPDLSYLKLPSYKIHYSKNLKWSLFFQTPKVLKAVREEKRVIAHYVQENEIAGIISDNRFGVRSTEIPSVYITHQINVLSGIFTFFTSKIHQKLIKNFDECWIPDIGSIPTLSGKLSQTKKNVIKTKRVGVLSRFQKEKKPIDIDVLIVLSGPEPYRTTLESALIGIFEADTRKSMLVQGVISEKQITSRKGNLEIYNFMLSNQLQDVMNRAALVICRSGYSSILDVAKLNKKVFFIPTPGQSEQEYLAHYLDFEKRAPYSKQKAFDKIGLTKIAGYQGFLSEYKNELTPSLLDLFEGKRKN